MGERRFSGRVVVSIGVLVVLAACNDDGGGGSVEAWCDVMDEANEVDQLLGDVPSASPAQLEVAMTRVEELIPQVVEAAPEEIADDVAVVAESTQKLIDALKAADYSLFDTDFSATADPDEAAAVDEANDNLDEFSIRECGQPFGGDEDDDGDDGDSTFDLGEGTIREQLTSFFVSLGLTQTEAECLSAQADPTDTALLEGDQDAIINLFLECGIPLERLSELGG